MSLRSEIHTLRAQIDAHAREVSAADTNAASASEQQKSTLDSLQDRPEVEMFLTTMNETLDEFAHELDKYPRLTALAALGVGLAVGVVIGRHLR